MKKKLIAPLCSLVLFATILVASPTTEINAATNRQQDEWIATTEYYAETYQGYDQDGMYGAQCVDLVFNYAANIFPVDYYGDVIYGNADQIQDKANLNYFDKIAYSPELVERGDILVYCYGPGSGSNGHVVVVSDVYPGGMTVVNQHVNSREYVEIDDCPGYLLWGYGIADFILRPIDMYSAVGGSTVQTISYKSLSLSEKVTEAHWNGNINAKIH